MADEGRAPTELLFFRSSLLLQKNKRERADTGADSQASVGSNSSGSGLQHSKKRDPVAETVYLVVRTEAVQERKGKKK